MNSIATFFACPSIFQTAPCQRRSRREPPVAAIVPDLVPTARQAFGGGAPRVQLPVREVRELVDCRRGHVAESQGWWGRNAVTLCTSLGVVTGMSLGSAVAAAVSPLLGVAVGCTVVAIGLEAGAVSKHRATAGKLSDMYGADAARLDGLIARLEGKTRRTDAESRLLREANHLRFQLRGRVDLMEVGRTVADAAPRIFMQVVVGLVVNVIIDAVLQALFNRRGAQPMVSVQMPECPRGLVPAQGDDAIL